MQDRNYKEMTSRGWESMESILDKEMPVKKDKKRLWLLLLLIGVSFAGASIWWFGSGEEKEGFYVNGPYELAESTNLIADNEKISSELIAKDSGKSEVDNELQKTITKVIASAHNSLEKDLIIRSLDPNIKDLDISARPKKSTLIAVENDDEHVAITNNELGDIQSISDVIQNSGLDLQTEDFSLILPNVITDKLQNENGLQNRELLSESSPLPSLYDGEEVPFEHIVPVLIPNIAKKKKSIDLSFEVGGIFSVVNNLNGLYAGLAVNKGISSRWSLASGLEYMRLSKLLMEAREFDANVSNVQNPTGMNNGNLEDVGFESFWGGQNYDEINSEHFNTIYSNINRISIISIPLIAQYKMTAKSKVGLGMNYNYVLGAKNGIINLADLEKSFSANNAAFDRTAVQESGLVNRHFLQLSTSLRYEISRHFGIHTAFNLGTRELLRSEMKEGLRNTLTYIKIGIDYTL